MKLLNVNFFYRLSVSVLYDKKCNFNQFLKFYLFLTENSIRCYL